MTDALLKLKKAALEALPPVNDEAQKTVDKLVQQRSGQKIRSLSTFYVAGFCFTPDRTHVALIQKNKPVWQAGRWNGIGGELEPGESWAECMSREFQEEAGVSIPPGDWEHTVTLYNEHFECRFFRCFSDLASSVRTIEHEQVKLRLLQELEACAVIDNLRWLIPLQLDLTLQFPLAPIFNGSPIKNPENSTTRTVMLDGHAHLLLVNKAL